MIVSHFEADPHDVRKDSQKAEILEPFRLYERGETAAFSEPPSWYPFFFQLRSDELRLALEKRWYGYTFSFCEPGLEIMNPVEVGLKNVTLLARNNIINIFASTSDIFPEKCEHHVLNYDVSQHLLNFRQFFVKIGSKQVDVDPKIAKKRDIKTPSMLRGNSNTCF